MFHERNELSNGASHAMEWCLHLRAISINGDPIDRNINDCLIVLLDGNNKEKKHEQYFESTPATADGYK